MTEAEIDAVVAFLGTLTDAQYLAAATRVSAPTAVAQSPVR
jgi:hypothetical protein